MKRPDGRFQTIFVHKFTERDPMKQVDIIGRLMLLFNVKQLVADIGYGAVQVSELQKKFGPRVMGCQYTRRPEISLEIKERDEFGRRIAQMMVLADRSFWIETVIECIKHKAANGSVTPALILPWNNPLKVEWVIDQFTCIEMEEQETVSGKRYHHYTHPEGEPDDALHAFVYALIAESVSERINQPLVVMDLFS
jgi:nitrogen regulatory protein PII